MSVDSSSVRRRLAAFEFEPLFVQDLGWDRYRGPLEVAVDGRRFVLNGVAEKRGMVAFELQGPDGELPPYAMRRKIERQVARSVHEHVVIYTDRGKTTQVWQWVGQESGRFTPREHIFRRGQSGEALIQKLDRLAFTLEEESSLTLVDVTTRVRAAFDVERVTRRFYERFKVEHERFLSFIKGITSQEHLDWYASVMLNRLMFVYFIQRKGFLDGDRDYLRTRLGRLREDSGPGQFHSFYRHFLLRLFHDGLAQRSRSPELDQLLGHVPYLNGGLFELHELERRYPSIHIPDDAFERIFDFFDSYQWHLDDRALKTDNEVNPDVLGYIFEKFINQKQMGAYYTREDITEYITSNSLVPCLFEKLCESSAAFAWESVVAMVAAEPSRYIYPTLAHGADIALPADLSVEVDARDRQDGLGAQPPATVGLIGETWRDVVIRRQEYSDLMSRLTSSERWEPADLPSLNIQLRVLAEDVIDRCDSPAELRDIYLALESLTVLDPTCGSGAFLFAALNTLEPLYEASIERMEAFLIDDEHAEPVPEDFAAIIERVQSHPTRSFFVLKTVVMNNIYGVDIMEEAVEICKLRFFLRLVAEVERAEDLEPLPDIDFNIRAGNTLVGFASRLEMDAALGRTLDGEHSLERLEGRISTVDQAFGRFRDLQLGQAVDDHAAAAMKRGLRDTLSALRVELNAEFAAQWGGDQTQAGVDSWVVDHQPFHWFVEFHDIMSSGGFDVIIGNPPYVEVPTTTSRDMLTRTFRTALDRWSRDEDVFAFVLERSFVLAHSRGSLGFVLPLTVAFSTKKPFEILRGVIREETGHRYFSHFDRIPSALFGNEVRTRCTILLVARGGFARLTSTTALTRWTAETRGRLFPTLRYSRVTSDIDAGIAKVGSQCQADTLEELAATERPLARDLTRGIGFGVLAAAAPDFPQPAVYVGGTAYNWFPVWRDIPQTTDINGRPSLPARTAGYHFDSEADASAVFALLASSLGYWWWAVASDGFNLKKWLLNRFPLSLSGMTTSARDDLAVLGEELRGELRQHYVYKDNRGRIGNYFLPACAPLVRVIDNALAHNVPALSERFFSDIRLFNERFSRSSGSANVTESYARQVAPMQTKS